MRARGFRIAAGLAVASMAVSVLVVAASVWVACNCIRFRLMESDLARDAMVAAAAALVGLVCAWMALYLDDGRHRAAAMVLLVLANVLAVAMAVMCGLTVGHASRIILLLWDL